MKKFLVLILLLSMRCFAQTVRTAASANESDVATAVAASANGDTVQIPCSGTQSVTWTSTLTVSASITITALGATPNTGASTFGAGTNCLTITSATGILFELDPTYSATNNTVTLQNITLLPGSGAYTPIHVSGTGTSSGMPLFRVDNIQFGNGSTQWAYGQGSNTGEFLIIENNVFGVADHNTTPTGSHVAFISVNLTAYLGVGQYGDNSWAQPDSTGGPQNFFIENNQLYQGLWPIVENEQTYPNIGGGRAVTRFNHITASGIFFLTGGHGNDTDGRPRSMRTNETYANPVNCVNDGNGNACYDFLSFRGGSGIGWGNTATLGSGAVWNEIGSLATYRMMGDGWAFSNEGSCGGAMSGNAYGPFDQNDGVAYYTGTFTSGTSGVTLVTSGSPGWASNQWSNPSGGYPYSVWDVTQGWVSIIQSNGSNTLNVSQAPHGYINGSTAINASSGDSFKITRSKSCLDGGARGPGLLLTGQPAVLASTSAVGPANEVLDPVYEWDDTVPSLGYGDEIGVNYSPPAQANREFFTDNALGSPHAQTSLGTPYTSTVGVAFGLFAYRPTTGCTNFVSGAPGCAYWATNQGSWNTSSNTYGAGYSQGVLYAWNGSAWITQYTPYTYPHPLAGGSSGISLTVTIAGTGAGNVTGIDCATGGYTSGTTIGTCTATPVGTSTLTSLVGTGNASCSGSTCTSFNLTSTSTITATFAAGASQAATPIITPATQTYPRTQTASITCSTPSNTINYTLDNSSPTTGSPVYSGPFAVLSTTTVKAACNATGYVQSLIASSIITITSAITLDATNGVLATCGNQVSPGTSAVCTPAAPAFAGDTILVDGYDRNNSMTTPTDGINTYTLVTTANDTANPAALSQWVACNVAAGFPTIYFTGSGVHESVGLNVEVLANTSTSNPCWDNSAVTQATIGTSISTNAGVTRLPAHSNERIEGFLVPDIGPPYTPGTNFTLWGTGGGSSEFWNQTTATTTNCPQTLSASSDYAAACMGILASSTLPVTATPMASPLGGTYTSTQTVALSDTTPSSTIIYCTDTTNTCTPATTYSTAITVSSTGYIRTFATASGYTQSTIAFFGYIITPPLSVTGLTIK